MTPPPRRGGAARRLASAVLPVLAAAATGGAVAVALVSPATPAPLPGVPQAPPTVAADVEVESAAYAQAVTAAQGARPRITVIGTGGTIAGVATGRDTPTDYRGGTIPIADLVGQLQPELAEVADVTTVQFDNKGSGGYTIAEYHALSLAVDEALETSDGVVVTTGTDTMEEFAYWLDLTVQSPEPVVLTGAMRPWAAGAVDGPLVLGADGPANLYNAIALSASQVTYCYGTVLMLNDEFHAARDVTKTSTTRLDTFQTRELGVLGWLDGPEIKVGRAPARVQDCDDQAAWAPPFDLSTIPVDALPRTEVVHSYQEAGGEAITAFTEAGVRGIVTAGTGAGGPSPAQAAARTAAVAQGVVFVSSSRTGSGSVTTSSGEGVIAGVDLLPQKARLLLLLALAAAPDDPAAVAQLVTEVGNPEFETAP